MEGIEFCSKSGEKFYGGINIKAKDTTIDKCIYIGSYGNEKNKPIIDGSNKLVNMKAWEKYEDNIYRIKLNKENFNGVSSNVDNLTFNIGFILENENEIIGNRKEKIEDLKNNKDFYCDKDYMYIKMDVNPSVYFKKIEISMPIILMNLYSNMIIDGIEFRNTSVHGITNSGRYVKNIIIKNCIIKNIGGGLINQNSFTRYGNGIEFWNSSCNTITQNCIFNNIYDAAWTIQGDNVSEVGFQNNILKDNIIINTSYPTEIFAHYDGKTDKSKISNTSIENNLIINQGRGWGYEVRPDQFQPAVSVVWLIPSNSEEIRYSKNEIFNARKLYFKHESLSIQNYKESVSSNYNEFYIMTDTITFLGEPAHKENGGVHTDWNILNELGFDQNSKVNYISEEYIKKINNIEIINSDDYETIRNYYNGLKEDYDNQLIIDKIGNKNNEIKNNNAEIYKNNTVEKKYNDFIKKVIDSAEMIKQNKLEIINELYKEQFEIIKTITDEKESANMELARKDFEKYTKEIFGLTDIYKELYNKYVQTDDISNENVKEEINGLINRYNSNTDLDISNSTMLIESAKKLFENNINGDEMTDNYTYKREILCICDIAEYILDYDVKATSDKEAKMIEFNYSKDLETLTNDDIYVYIKFPNDKCKTLDNQESYKIEKNGTYKISINIRGVVYEYDIIINNIDKTSPKVTAQNGKSLKINVTDDSLKEIKIEKDGKEMVVNNGKVITTPGIYKITGTDKAGNSTNETAIVYGTYTNEQNSQVKYVTIKAKTKVRDVKQDCDYTIKDNNNITAGIKRAPSPEKDSNSYIATGDILQDNSNTYIVITLGDLSSNGDVGVADLIKLRKSLVGLTKLTKLQELAADTNQNGIVNVSDLLKERKIMVGMEQ